MEDVEYQCSTGDEELIKSTWCLEFEEESPEDVRPQKHWR